MFCYLEQVKHVMVKRIFYVPLGLWDAAKAKAKENDETISDVLRRSLERYVR